MEYNRSRAGCLKQCLSSLMTLYSGGPTSAFWKLRLIQNVFQLEGRNSQYDPHITHNDPLGDLISQGGQVCEA